MFEAFKVGITIALTNTVSSALGLMEKDFIKTDIQAAKLRNTLNEMKLSGVKAAMELGAAFAIASPFIVAISDAAKLQKEMIGIQAVTRGTTAEMENMRKAIENVAGKTMFSIIDVAKMSKTIAAGTGLSANQVSGLLPEYGKFADVQLLLKGTPYEKSVVEGIRLAHTAGHYDPESLHNYLDLLTKASFVVPGGLGEVGNALLYSQGMAKKALGVDDEQMVLFTALLNRMGLKGSRGGTNAIAAMVRSVPGMFGSGLLHGRSGEALKAMNMADASGHATFFRDGKFNAVVWMKEMSDYVAKEMATHPEAIARQNILKNFQFAFGVQGARVASLLSDPQALEQWKLIGEEFNKGAGTDFIQALFADQSVYQKYENAQTNFTSAMTELGYKLLPMAATGLTYLNRVLGGFIKMAADPKNDATIKRAEQALIGLSAALAFSGTVNLLKFAFSGLRLVMFTFLGAGGLLSVGIMAGAAAFVLAGYEVYTHWNELKPKLISVWRGIIDWLNGLLPSWAQIGTSNGSSGSWGSGSVSAPPKGSGTTVVNQITLDSRQLNHSFMQHVFNGANGPAFGGQSPDPRLSFVQP